MPAAADLEGAPRLQAKAPVARPAPIPEGRHALLFVRDATGIEERSPSSAATTAASAKSCGPNDTRPICARPVDATSNTTIPVVLGVVIPLTVAFVIFIILHRRHVKKLRQEDKNDPHKSLDFGIEESKDLGGKRNKKSRRVAATEMSMAQTQNEIRRGRGLSMDMSGGNPFLLPPGLQQSRESLHSLSRAMSSEDDRYARATSYIPREDNGSYPSSLRRGPDDSSSYTASSRRTGFTEGGSSQNLIRHNQRMSRSMPPHSGRNTPQINEPEQAAGQGGLRKPSPTGRNPNGLAPVGLDQPRDSYVSSTSSNGGNIALRASHNYLGAFIRGGFLSEEEKKQDEKKSPAAVATKAVEAQSPTPELTPAFAPEKQSAPKANPRQQKSPQPQEEQPQYKPAQVGLRGDDATDDFRIDSHQEGQSRKQPAQLGLRGGDAAYDFRLPSPPAESELDLGLRHASTLPQIGGADTSSFYEPKVPNIEVHDDEEHHDQGDGQNYRQNYAQYQRHSMMGIRPLPPDDPSENPEQRANRIRSFYKEYFEENRPGKQPTYQHYYDGSENYGDQGYYDDQYYGEGYDQGDEYYDYDGYDQGYDDPYYGQEHYSQPMGLPPVGPRFRGQAGKPRSFSSVGHYPPPRKAMSTVSGGGPRRKKALPPPKALHVLPTPHKLKDDLYLPIDFAPPSRTMGQRAGTPDGLSRGGERPYSPTVRAHLPIASSFDDLAVMPSP